MREDIFSKFKDYNSELEKILEKKDFSKDSKNLLLSMFYKLETAYDDYETVKRKVKTKQEYLENILENIKYCNNITLVKPNTEEFAELKNENKIFEVDLKLRKIRVIENELYLLSAILELNNFKIYLDERYNLIRNSFPYILNTGNDMDNTEVLRDFNAFSWNVSESEIENIYTKLVYEDLKFALSENLIKKIQETPENFDLIKYIREVLEDLYEKKDVDEFIELIFRLAIIIYTNESKYEKKRLHEEKKVIEEELEKIKNKKEYINEIIKRKIELNKKVKNLDLILNNDTLLLKEFNETNSENQYNKLFNIRHFKAGLERNREKAIIKIEECNKKLEPKNYIENKDKLQINLDLLKNIKFEEKEDNFKILQKELLKLQKTLLDKMLPKIVNRINTKEEAIDFIYQLRYYNYIPYMKGKMIYEEKSLKNSLETLLRLLLKKMYKLKLINNLSTNEKNDIEIVKNIFFVRIINLEDIYIELNKKNTNLYELDIFDGKETLETTKELDLQFNKKDRVKLKKQIKLFK